jgi:RND superfamily putative drug exporter
MYDRIGRLAANRPWLICFGWAAAAVAVALVAPRWDNRAQDDDVRFLPARCDSVRGYKLLEQAFPQDVFASRVIFAVERQDRVLSAADLALVDAVADDLDRLRTEEPALQLKRVSSHRDPYLGQRLVSADGRCTLIEVSLGTPYLAVQTRSSVDRAEAVVRRRLAGETDAPQLLTTGPAGVGRDLTAAGADSLEGTTLATVVLVIVVLLLVYRAPLLALIPLFTIAASVFVALKLLAICTLIPGFYLVNISQVFAVVMLYGAGTDYCLFLISRYREELTEGQTRKAAISNSVAGVGGALAASAGTVVCGLGMMGLAEFAKIRSGGPAIAISLVVALAASLTLAPALLRILGAIAFWPVGAPRRRLGWRPEDLWGRLSRLVVARPVCVWVGAVLVLMPLVVLGARVRPNYRATGELSANCQSVQGLATIQRHFTAGEVGPITFLLESNQRWDDAEGEALLAHLSRGFGLLDNVAEVRGLTQPLGEPLEEEAAASGGKDLLHALWANASAVVTRQTKAKAAEYYLAHPKSEDGQERYVARLDVVLKSDPFDPRSLPTLEALLTWLRAELPPAAAARVNHAECYGVTVGARDLAQVTESDRRRINVLVLGGVFLILLAVVRRPWLAAYLLATVLFSYYATLGATTVMAHFWAGRPLGEVDWRVPFFLFTILVAVGEDYNILLITRTLQEMERYGPKEGTRRGLANTGGTITSCGVIMAGTFATLMLAGLNTLVQIGFALAFGVLLDTFVVRPFLVPAFTVWVWRSQEDAARRNPAKAATPAVEELLV